MAAPAGKKRCLKFVSFASEHHRWLLKLLTAMGTSAADSVRCQGKGVHRTCLRRTTNRHLNIFFYSHGLIFL